MAQMGGLIVATVASRQALSHRHNDEVVDVVDAVAAVIAADPASN